MKKTLLLLLLNTNLYGQPYCKNCQSWFHTSTTDTSIKHWVWTLPNSSWSFASNPDSIYVLLNIGTTGGTLKVKGLNNQYCAGAIRQTNISVTQTVTPTIHISVNTNHLFSQTHTNGGGSPKYKWIKDGAVRDSIHSSWKDNNWFTGSMVVCVMKSSVVCTTQNPVTSNTIVE